MCDIFRYHRYRFLKSPPLRGNIKFFFPVSVNILWHSIYILPIITLAECDFIKMVDFTPNESPPNVTYFCQSDLKYGKNYLKLGKSDLKYYDLKWNFPLGGLTAARKSRYQNEYHMAILFILIIHDNWRRQGLYLCNHFLTMVEGFLYRIDIHKRLYKCFIL